MAFDPNQPTENTMTDAVLMRGQLNALKALNDALQAQVTTLQAQVTALQSQVNLMASQGAALAQQVSSLPTPEMVNDAIASNSAANANAVQLLDGTPSDPPTQMDVMGLMYKVNELITTVHRS